MNQKILRDLKKEKDCLIKNNKMIDNIKYEDKNEDKNIMNTEENKNNDLEEINLEDTKKDIQKNLEEINLKKMF